VFKGVGSKKKLYHFSLKNLPAAHLNTLRLETIGIFVYPETKRGDIRTGTGRLEKHLHRDMGDTFKHIHCVLLQTTWDG